MDGRKKEAGNIGELLTMGLCVLALTVVMCGYLENMQMIGKKAAIGQLARGYLLRMETVGYLEDADRVRLTTELESLEPAGYGNRIILQIHGKLGEQYDILEKRVSTAKN